VDELNLARAAAREAGHAIMRAFGTQHTVIYKSPDQPQTAADLEADRILHRILLGAHPDYGWLSEETADDPARLERARVWIVDPIDGTRSYMANRPEFAISIALAEHGRAVLGVISNPATGELFWAIEGEGAFDGTGQRLRVTDTRSLPAVLIASRSEIRAGDFRKLGLDWQLQPMGSTAYKLALTAAGRADIFLSRGPKSEWDVCAGDLIVREAGGRVTDLHGSPLRYNRRDPYVHGILASNGCLHEIGLNQVAQMPDSGKLRPPGDDE
jgi:myo-inositol-1(or 4)-monophosphatase